MGPTKLDPVDHARMIVRRYAARDDDRLKGLEMERGVRSALRPRVQPRGRVKSSSPVSAGMLLAVLGSLALLAWLLVNR